VRKEDVVFVLSGLLCGSDYSGSAVEVSNRRLFLDAFGELDGIHEVYGGHGSFGIAIRLDVWEAALTPARHA
jgi:hypothetical protein